MDELGSGVRNTYRFADLYNPGAVPTFIEGDVFEVIVPLENESSEESSEEVRGNTRDSVLRLLRKDNKRTAKDLYMLIGVTDRAIEKHLAKLQKEGKLQRIGSTKSGYWHIVDE